MTSIRDWCLSLNADQLTGIVPLGYSSSSPDVSNVKIVELFGTWLLTHPECILTAVFALGMCFLMRTVTGALKAMPATIAALVLEKEKQARLHVEVSEIVTRNASPKVGKHEKSDRTPSSPSG